LFRSTRRLHPAAASRHDQGLAERVDVSRGTGAGLESDAGARSALWMARIEQRIDPDRAGEVVCRSLAGRLRAASLDLHLFPPSGVAVANNCVEPVRTAPAPDELGLKIKWAPLGLRSRLALISDFAPAMCQRGMTIRGDACTIRQGVARRRRDGRRVYDAEHEERYQRTTGPAHSGRPGGTRPPDRAVDAARRDDRVAAGSTPPPLFEADRTPPLLLRARLLRDRAGQQRARAR